MVLAAKIQVYATPILCLIWLAGFVLALVKFRVSPRASVLFIIACSSRRWSDSRRHQFTDG
ncbi:MAG: hypothetical protein IPG80_21390 [Anaerolineales bacterium]|uniref:hypothetical protein n=1 Tax=Candidatus Villigracilis vicinus TaxID=3140679 RepID=UPI0031354ECB|nr:hypothetical protein [Anaerolineales bacterium]